MPPRSRPQSAATGSAAPASPAGSSSSEVAVIEPTRAPLLPVESAPEPPDVLAALDAGDDAAVWRWVRAQLPEPASLAVHSLYLGAGLLGLVEWPAVALGIVAQVVVDRRFGGVEQLAGELRRRVDALAARPA